MMPNRSNVTILDGSNFVVSDYIGDITDVNHGYYVSDTKYISKYILSVNGAQPIALTSNTLDYYSAAFYLQSESKLESVPPIVVERKRLVSDVFYEQNVFRNFSNKSVRADIKFEIDCDFKDLFDVKAIAFMEKDLVFQKASQQRSIERKFISHENAFSFSYSSEDSKFSSQALVWFSMHGNVDEEKGTIAFDALLDPQASWRVVVDAVPIKKGQRRRERYTNAFFGLQQKRAVESFEKWDMSIPHLVTDMDILKHLYEQSFLDLAALRIHDPDNPEYELPAAGLPWFMTVFGRDTLITSYETLLFGPNLSIGALRTLSKLQSTTYDDAHDSEPGKIVHEMRFGEVGVRSGQFPYYGTADATLLFLILGSEVYRWTAATDLLNELKPNFLAALAWIQKYGDPDGDGFIEYKKRSETGLDNQCWKDSWNSILFKDGRLAEPPIATCEIQGYAFLAMNGFSDIARNVWDDSALASELSKSAQELKAKFNEAFWTDDGHYALALDKDKHRVDSLTSNIGHLLWTGIIDDSRVNATVEQLMSEEMFSGWGIRTMSTKDRGFNPIGYHDGTVWPHDNALIVYGLARYGKNEEAMRIILSLLEAGAQFDYRLPEVFAGMNRTASAFTVEYPTASSPQAWAAASPVLLLRTILGIEPDIAQKTIRAHPIVPKDFIYRIFLSEVRAFGKKFDISLEGKSVTVSQT